MQIRIHLDFGAGEQKIHLQDMWPDCDLHILKNNINYAPHCECSFFFNCPLSFLV